MSTLPPHELDRLKAAATLEEPLETLIERRLSGEPLQYIEGVAAFCTLKLKVDSRVFIPRPETEGIVTIAREVATSPNAIIDLCTGSGALGLALKGEFPKAPVFTADISQDAADVALANRWATDLHIYVAIGDLWDPLPAYLYRDTDLIVANPPYIAESEYDDLPEDVKREPREALVAGPTGLEVIQRIGATVAGWLNPGGAVICEIGETQGDAARNAFLDLPAEVRQDHTGRDRYVVAVKPSDEDDLSRGRRGRRRRRKAR